MIDLLQLATELGYWVDEWMLRFIGFFQQLQENAEIINATLGETGEVVLSLDESLVIVRCEGRYFD